MQKIIYISLTIIALYLATVTIAPGVYKIYITGYCKKLQAQAHDYESFSGWYVTELDREECATYKIIIK